MRRLLLVFALGTAVALAAPVVAHAGSASNAPTAADKAAAADAEIAGWTKRLDDAKARLETAQKHLDELLAMKSRGSARRYPTGDAKGKYLEDLRITTAEYEKARLELPELIEEARRAGLFPSVLEPYEAIAQAAAPAPNADTSARADDEPAADEPANDGGAASEDPNPNHSDDNTSE